MQMTLLECTQHLLSAMASDEVNSINDTTESQLVAQLLKGVFYDVATDIGLPQHEKMIEISASGDVAKPTLMTLPSGVARLSWIKYDNKVTGDSHSDYRDVNYVPFKQFLEMQQGLRGMTSGVGEMTFTSNGESHNIMYMTDRFPSCYTHLDNNTLIFDAYDSTEDTTLQKSKVMAFAWVYPTWTMSDSFVPPLDPGQFSYYLNKAKARAFLEIKEEVNPEATNEARRQKVVLQSRKKRLPSEPAIMRAPRFGR